MSEIIVGTSELGNELTNILMADDIQPGSNISYELAKAIYLFHPLGQKMAEAPVTMAQSQARKVTVQDAPDEVMQTFSKEWEKLGADAHIHNVTKLSRMYGIASLILGCEEVKSNEPLPMERLHELPIFISALDPLNTAGSLVLSQVPTNPDFNKPVVVRTNGEEFHRSRYQVVMNEAPVYLAYTSSAFGFVGRSVYQRALYPLKSFVRTMIADDMIAKKLGLLIAKQEQPGSILDQVMAGVASVKRSLLRTAQTNNVLSIGVSEIIETLNMQNVDGAGAYSRGNILKNVATAADMPAVLLENETLTEGFGEGTEDAKSIARYIEQFRRRMQPLYAWFDNIVQYRAWNELFYLRMQTDYASLYAGRTYQDVFFEWRKNFSAGWPSLLIEPESEQIKVEQTKLEGVVAFAQTFLPECDPENKARLIEWAADTISENKMMFPHALTLDAEAMAKYSEEQQQKQMDALQTAAENGGGGGKGGSEEGGAPGKPASGLAKKFGKFGG